jgi:uncharacterized short protein YbdD (DUF466 family)
MREAAMMLRKLGRVWHYLREVSGDDAYERYVAHHRQAHPGEQPMTQAQYFRFRQDQKWSKVSRCC